MGPTTAPTERSQRGAVLLAEEMRATAAPARVEAGAVVAWQGEEGRKFCLVESGALDVVIASEEGLRLPVARLGPGSHFGEMSLLAGMPVSADVVAAEPSVLYGVSPSEFDALMRRRPELVEYLAGELAVRLKLTNARLAAQQQRQAVLSSLIGARRGAGFTDALPSFGKQLQAAVAAARDSDLPLLLVGEKGVGRKALALHLHTTGPRRAKPVIVVDCRELPWEGARSLLFGQASPESVSRFSDHLGYVQAADRGTLLLAHLDRLPPEVQDDLAAFVRTHAEASEETRVSVRIIGTVTTGAFSEALAQVFAGGQTIQLRPLRDRRRDIAPLAEHFLKHAAQLSGGPRKQLGESAKRKLLTYDFRSENAEELRQVVNLGAELAEAEVISADHLFFGAGIGVETPQIDLLRWGWVEQVLTRGRLIGIAKVVVGLVFAAIAAVCLGAPSSRAGQAANVLVWGLWWPALILLSLLLGRAWCAICPISTGAEIVQRSGGLGLPPMSRLKEAWPLPALVGFALILWIEHATAMETHPRATAVLLLSLALLAAALGWLYQRHTWCRYVCPLGAMSAAFSTVSALRVHARREVCQASCTGNECYKGSETAQGCPMFNHALFLNSGEYCKLCLECLRACPVRSPRLLLRLPLQDLWRSDLISAEVAPLTLVVGLMALLLAATPELGSSSPLHDWWFTFGTLAAVGAGLALSRVVRPAQQEESKSSPSWLGRVTYAYTPAVAAVLFAFHLESLPWVGDVSLGLGGADREFFQVSLLHLLQGTTLCLGGLLTLWTLWRLCRLRSETRTKAVAAWIPPALLAAAYLGAALLVLV